VANPTPGQVAVRDRIESVVALVSPLLDGLLAVGERVSRIAGPSDEYYPVRPAGEAFELVPAQRAVLNADGSSDAAVSSTGDAE
jgi:hypothetical protein